MVGGAFTCVESMAGALGGVGLASEGRFTGTLGGVGLTTEGSLCTEGTLFPDGTGGAGGLIFGIGGIAPPECDACEEVERLGKPFDLGKVSCCRELSRLTERLGGCMLRRLCRWGTESPCGIIGRAGGALAEPLGAM